MWTAPGSHQVFDNTEILKKILMRLGLRKNGLEQEGRPLFGAVAIGGETLFSYYTMLDDYVIRACSDVC